MSPRSLFIILIKLFGINIILQALGLIVPMLSVLFTPGFEELEGEYIAYTILGVLFFMLIFGVAINYCIFKPEWIIDKLDLDKGFVEEKFELNIHTSTILRIATIVAGMMILIEGIPNLLRFGFELIETRQSFQDNKPYSPGWILFSFAKTLIGLLMVTSNRRIVSFIESKRRSR